MKNETNRGIHLRVASYFVTRAPFLNTEKWRAYRASTERECADISAAITWDKRAYSAARLFAESDINEAIFLASRSLHQRLTQADWSSETSDNVKILLAFERYVNRMCFRSTPFGRFATVAAGMVTSGLPNGSETFEDFGGDGTGIRQARIDFNYLLNLWEDVVKSYPQIIKYGPNSSITALDGKLTYIDWINAAKGEKLYHLSEVDSNLFIAKIFDICFKGAASPAHIASELDGKDEGITSAIIFGIIDDLIEANLLIPLCPVDLLNPLAELALVEFLKSHTQTVALGTSLALLIDDLAGMSHISSFGITARYKEIEVKLLEMLPSYGGKLIRVDVVRDGEKMQLSSVFAEEFSADIGLLISKFGTEDVTLAPFRERFQSKYGAGHVPLTELLKDGLLFDDMQNAAYPSLLTKLGIYKKATRSLSSVMSLYEKFLASKLVAKREGNKQNVLFINEDEIKALPARNVRFPRHIFAIMTALYAGSSYKESLIRLMGISNANIGTWQGRFCYALGDSFAALQRTAAEVQEADANILHAEISYMPSGDFSNILNRPNFWNYRINLIDTARNNSGGQIPLSDIEVGIVGNEVQIFSRRHGRRVIPHMTTAHNVRHPSNMAAYIFLRQLETQGMMYSSFNWSGIFKNFDYLPRIQYKNIILSSERWVLVFTDYAKYAGTKKPGNGGRFCQYLAHRGLPRFVELKDGDNTLMLDIDSELDVEQIFRILKIKRRLIIQEVADHNGNHSIDGRVNRHELLFPLEITDKEPRHIASEPHTSIDVVINNTPIGIRDNVRVPLSVAIYVKAYVSDADADDVLLGLQKNFIDVAHKSGGLDKWFFIRYIDPEPHLRLRFFPIDGDRFGELLLQLVRHLEQFQASGLVKRIELCNYERELVRYGGPSRIKLSEQLFHIDSELALMIIGAAPRLDRWKLCVWAVHAFLCDLEYAPVQAHRCILYIANKFKAEFGVSGEQLMLLGKHFRSCSLELTSIVAADSGETVPWIRRLVIATADLRGKRSALLSLLKAGLSDTVQVPFDTLIASHIHMLCNRLITTQPRAYEVLVYDMLERLLRPAALQGSDAIDTEIHNLTRIF